MTLHIRAIPNTCLPDEAAEIYARHVILDEDDLPLRNRRCYVVTMITNTNWIAYRWSLSEDFSAIKKKLGSGSYTDCEKLCVSDYAQGNRSTDDSGRLMAVS